MEDLCVSTITIDLGSKSPQKKWLKFVLTVRSKVKTFNLVSVRVMIECVRLWSFKY